MNRKEIKRYLKSSCYGVLHDLLNDVGFTTDEKALFTETYIKHHSVIRACLNIPCGTNKYNYTHNNVLDKIISHFSRIK